MATSLHRARTVGRPPQARGVAARGALLDAAITLFAEQGVTGTTFAEIAARAGVTAAMVHYYFAGREELLDAVVAERLVPVVTGVWAPVVESSQSAPLLRGFVERILRAAEQHPWLPSLWLREISVENGELRSRLFRSVRFDYMQHLIETVTAAQRRGELNPAIEPRLVFVSVLGITLLPLANIGVLKQLAPLEGITREDVARHAGALLASAFSGRGSGGRFE